MTTEDRMRAERERKARESKPCGPTVEVSFAQHTSDKRAPGVIDMSHVNSKHAVDLQDLDPNLLLAYQHLIAYLQRGHVTESERANYADTAVRAAKAFRELTASREEIAKELKEILSTGFPREPVLPSASPRPQSLGLITQGPIQVFSMCPHHLLQVEYSVFVSYIPSANGGPVLGLSKLARIAKLLGKRPILQEQLASDIADALYHVDVAAEVAVHEADAGEAPPVRFPGIHSHGGAVLLTGKHSCMSCRGVHSAALTSVTELRGGFWEDGLEQKFYQAVAAITSSNLR